MSAGLAGALAATRVRGLRANSFAAVVILVVDYGLGMWVNLYGQLPASDHGASIATGFARAIHKGPVGLSVHALLGVILIVSALTAVVRAVLVRRSALIGATAAGPAAIVTAAFSGASFVGDGSNSSSMGMAVAAGVAMAAYALVLLVSAGIAVSSRP
jgi:hypothetical protein